MCHVMPFLARPKPRALKKNTFFNVDIVVRKTNRMWFSVVSVLLSTTIRIITVVKICFELTRLHLVSPQHFDH